MLVFLCVVCDVRMLLLCVVVAHVLPLRMLRSLLCVFVCVLCLCFCSGIYVSVACCRLYVW